MSASVVMLFRRDLRVVADLPRDQTLRRARLRAKLVGCNEEQRALTAGYADGLLNGGMPSEKVIEAAESYARQLLDTVRA